LPKKVRAVSLEIYRRGCRLRRAARGDPRRHKIRGLASSYQQRARTCRVRRLAIGSTNPHARFLRAFGPPAHYSPGGPPGIPSTNNLFATILERNAVAENPAPARSFLLTSSRPTRAKVPGKPIRILAGREAWD